MYIVSRAEKQLCFEFGRSCLSLKFKSRERHCRVQLTFVLRSTHSTHDKVGLLRFCLFLGGSAVKPSSLCNGLVTGDALKVVSVTAGDVAEAYVIVPLYTNAGETGPLGPIGPIGTVLWSMVGNRIVHFLSISPCIGQSAPAAWDQWVYQCIRSGIGRLVDGNRRETRCAGEDVID